MKIIIISSVLIIFAISEVITTGMLYERFGVTNLALLYCFTTLLGTLILLSQIDAIKNLYAKVDIASNDELIEQEIQNSVDKNVTTPKLNNFFILNAYGLFYGLAWLLILIPGLLTDGLSFLLIGLWFVKKKDIEAIFL